MEWDVEHLWYAISLHKIKQIAPEYKKKIISPLLQSIYLPWI